MSDGIVSSPVLAGAGDVVADALTQSCSPLSRKTTVETKIALLICRPPKGPECGDVLPSAPHLDVAHVENTMLARLAALKGRDKLLHTHL
jgi:hypothetical protein